MVVQIQKLLFVHESHHKLSFFFIGSTLVLLFFILHWTVSIYTEPEELNGPMQLQYNRAVDRH